MTDLEDRLRRLSADATSDVPPVDQVTRRATQLRRRRRLAEATSATAVIAVVALLGVNLAQLTTPDTTDPNVVFEQPPAPLPARWTRTTIGPLTIDHPQAWKVRHVQGEDSRNPRVVLSNRRLSQHDLDLALLASDEVRFSARFPTDAVVFVVGGDYLAPPPAPDGALGDPRPLPRPRGFSGDVVARNGRVPQSILHLAAYIGPEAPAGAADAAGTVAERLRLRETPVSPADQPPPPPPDSRPFGGSGIQPDSPIFTEPWQIQAQIALDDDEVINVRVKGDCAAVTKERTVKSRNVTVEDERCGLTEPAAALERVTGGVTMGGSIAGDLGDAERHVIVARIGPDVRDVTARLVGRGWVRTETSNGWVIALAKGRIARLVAFDEDGRRLGVLTDQ